MSLDCICLVKQVPDTKRITGEAMTPEGRVNRSALTMVFNPEDLNGLEMALQVRERTGGTVTVLTMGQPQATEVLRDSLYRGADRCILLTDRRFGGADTLATGYSLACAIRMVGRYDLIFGGRQAIDGDTAQVGPQTAEKLGIPQLTYVERINFPADGRVRARRLIGGGYEVVEMPMPLLVTVTGTANEPRPPSAKNLMRFKHHTTAAEITMKYLREAGVRELDAGQRAELKRRIDAARAAGRLIPEWHPEDIAANVQRCGLAGSPTKVKQIESVILTGGQFRGFPPSDDGVRELVHELIEEHTLD
jgi:electron transfer flavoprotein beta subunit